MPFAGTSGSGIKRVPREMLLLTPNLLVDSLSTIHKLDLNLFKGLIMMIEVNTKARGTGQVVVSVTASWDFCKSG